ncbi:hypothetical protein [Nonomuraea sp. NPDC049141]|uniref:hypothetical protein n=1 Tax=Nonomuraea sp. NPDC049141 TaxID=3155500 RepID=UPI00340BECAD
MTSASRLLDVLPLFRSDPRVQVLFTVAAGSAFDDGVGDYLRDVEARVVSWAQAVDTKHATPVLRHEDQMRMKVIYDATAPSDIGVRFPSR